MKSTIPFCGPTYKSESRFLSWQECVNFYLRPFGENEYVLLGTPGLELWTTAGNGPIRASLVEGDYLYVVSGNRFFRVNSVGVAEDLGSVGLLPFVGRVSMATNGVDIVIVGGGIGYCYVLAAETLSQITDADFAGGDVIIQVDGYYLVNNPGTGQIWRSDYLDGSSWSGLAFATAGGDPDIIVSLVADHRDVWIIGEVTSEIWYNTGAETFNFARIEGAYIEQGGESHYSVTTVNNGVYWLGKDKRGNAQVFQASGRQPKTISDPSISRIISECQLSDAFMFSYQQLGHSFVVLTFPSSDVTLVYDSSTSLWHERSSHIRGKDVRWRANTHDLFFGEHIVGSFEGGKLYKMKIDMYDEDGDPLIAVRTTPVVRNKQNAITVDEACVMNEPGVGLVTGAVEDVDPHALLSWSRDGGRTWSPEAELSLGKIGEYDGVSRVTQLGQGRNWVFRYKISAAVKRVILGAYIVGEEDDA